MWDKCFVFGIGNIWYLMDYEKEEKILRKKRKMV